MKIPVKDSVEAKLDIFFDEAREFFDRVERCKGKVFVHCMAGVSRAPTIVMSYLVSVKRISLYPFRFCIQILL